MAWAAVNSEAESCSVVVGSMFIVAPMVCSGFFVFGLYFVKLYLVASLVLQSSP